MPFFCLLAGPTYTRSVEMEDRIMSQESGLTWGLRLDFKGYLEISRVHKERHLRIKRVPKFI